MDRKRRERPRLRFIPFRKRDIVDMCIAGSELKGREQIKFRDLCRLMQSVFHFEYHEKLEELKNGYAPLNPDRDTRKINIFAQGQDGDFSENLNDLLDKANYEKLTDAELAMAFEESSLFKLRLDVDFNDFEEVLIYSRGESIHREVIPYAWGMLSRTIEFSNFDRVVIYIKFSQTIESSRNKPGATMLKMFQSVPKADIEMLFPNTRVGMRTVDKLMIGIPALIGSGAILTTKMGTSFLLLGGLLGYWMGLYTEPVVLSQAALIALVASVGGLASYIWKQIANFKNRKLAFMQTLTENLYFKNLDNNAGVFHRLIDDAEEEECKEAFLAYYFLLTQPHLADAEALDRAVESWFADRWDSQVDFEVDDALRKLHELGLVIETADEFRAIDIDGACEIMDRRWDDYFSYNQSPTAPLT
jgi:hypothetical protein